MSDSENEVIDEPTASKKRRSFSIEQKMEALKRFRRGDKVTDIAKDSKVDRATVRDWAKQEAKLKLAIERKVSKAKRLAGHKKLGRPVKDEEFDAEVYRWVREKRQSAAKVSRLMVQAYAKQCMQARQVGEHEAAHKAHNCSNGWLDKFIRRYNLTYRRGTTVCQKPPEEYEELVVDFVRYVEASSLLGRLGVDEHRYRGQLPEDGLPKKPHCARQEAPRVGCVPSENTKAVMRELALHSAIVPGGCTKFIQAPDVCWNAPFKALLRHYIAEGQFEYTAAGNPKAPPMRIWLKWVVDAWDSLPDELIATSFKTCGLTTATNGSEDGLIHCFKADGPIPSGREGLIAKRTADLVNDFVDALQLPDADEDDENGYVSDDGSIELQLCSCCFAVLT